MQATLAEAVETEEQLDLRLSRPTPAVERAVQQLSSPLILLGAGGKMGPTLALMARRAAEAAGHPLEIIAASRFSGNSVRPWLETHGIRTVQCDLLDRAALRALPDSKNVLFLAGLKFGTGQHPALTWAINTLAPAHVCERYPDSSIIALSTGNVYPLTSVREGGAREHHPLTPTGEYANAAVARERVFEFFSGRNGTPILLVRLFYAVELRYGVLSDIAQKVWSGEALDVTTSHLNCIWQGDAHEMILRSFPLVQAPPRALNLTGIDALSVRELAQRFEQWMGRSARLTGKEAGTALLANTSLMRELLGEPATPIETTARQVALWVSQGNRMLGKPTRFEVRDGRY